MCFSNQYETLNGLMHIYWEVGYVNRCFCNKYYIGAFSSMPWCRFISMNVLFKPSWWVVAGNHSCSVVTFAKLTFSLLFVHLVLGLNLPDANPSVHQRLMTSYHCFSVIHQSSLYYQYNMSKTILSLIVSVQRHIETPLYWQAIKKYCQKSGANINHVHKEEQLLQPAKRLGQCKEVESLIF